MSDLISASALEDELTECPVCLDQFNQDVRIPRRMPCCVKSICQPCLQQLLQGLYLTNLLSCPLCRHKKKVTKGLDSFPKERVILKILDHLKLQKRIRLSCTDCPEDSPARYQCDNCQVFLCKKCRNAHTRNIATKYHSIVSLEDMRGRPVTSFRQRHECPDHPHPVEFFCTTCSKPLCVSCTIVNHKHGNGHDVVSIDEAHDKYAKSTEEVLCKLDKKKGQLVTAEKKLSKTFKDFQHSVDKTKKDIIAEFDDIIQKLQMRRGALLLEVDERAAPETERMKNAMDSTSFLLGKVTSMTDHIRNLRSKADKLEDLQLMTSSTGAMENILEEKSEDLQYDKKGVAFVPANTKELLSNIQVAGFVRTVSFTERGISENFPIFDINMEPSMFESGNLL